MDHDLELINPNPGNICKFDLYFLISWKYWKSDSSIFSYPGNTGDGRAETGGRLQGLCCAALDYFWNMFLENEHGNLGMKVKTNTFFENGSVVQTTMLIRFVSKF